MPVSFNDFLISAKNALTSHSEIDCRNSISRAYYAAYHEADRVSHVSNGSSSNTMGVHTKLCHKLKTHNGPSQQDANIINIGIQLAICKKMRVTADYKLSKKCTHINAKAIIILVENIILLAHNIK